MVTPLRRPKRPLPDLVPEDLWVWRPDDYMVRLYHEHPARPPLVARTFGPLNRFDPHIRDRRQKPREQTDGRGVNYLAESLKCGLAEAFPDQWPQVAICPAMRAIKAAPRAPETLLDITDDTAMRLGAVGTLGSGSEKRRLTQGWARAIYEDYGTLSGIRYRAAHQGGAAVAAWERAGTLLVQPGMTAPAPALLDPGMYERVKVALKAQGRVPVRVSAAHCPRCRAAAASIPR